MDAKALRLVVLLVLYSGSCAVAQTTRPASGDAEQARGRAVAVHGRPAYFPHRIWAFSDFEARPADFGWFGEAETSRIPRYPGNQAARRGTGPVAGVAALRNGMNPVPGPRMGHINQLYLRYYIEGTDEAIFQHFSLSVGDNAHIRVSGLREGVWSETVLNFTRDSRRNDGSPGAFARGERMDDFQLYVGKPDDGIDYTIIIDDPIFFAEDPRLPPEPEPFPRRVMFLAAFDTGVDDNSLAKYYPGRFAFTAERDAPPASYWGVAKAVAAGQGGDAAQHVVLEMKPPRTAGTNTKVRFRYWLKGADSIRVLLRESATGRDLTSQVKDVRPGEWVTQYVTFSRNGKTLDGKELAAGTPLDRIAFEIAGGPGEELYIDEVVLFDAGEEAVPATQPAPSATRPIGAAPVSHP